MAPARTVDDLLQLYAKQYLTNKAPRTQAQQHGLFRRFSEDLGTIPLDRLTPTILRSWSDYLRRSLKPGTVRQYLDSLSAVLTVAVEDLDWLEVHPLRKVPKPPASPKRVRFLTEEERHQLLEACRQSRNRGLYPLVLLAMTTGCRRGELFGLRWNNVDLEQGIVRLEHTKNGERRAVAVPPVAVDVLRVWRGLAPAAAWVFPRRGEHTAFPGENAWRHALKRAGLKDFRFHDLRHTAASYLAMSGARIEDIADVLGHKSLSMAWRYRHVTLPHTRAVVEKMAQQFLGETHEA
jgi:integrase